MMTYKQEKIKVEFIYCEVGWLRLTISAGGQATELHFSHFLDPLPELKIWLEAIALGVEQVSFSYNPEGSIIKFDFWETSYIERETEVDKRPVGYSSHAITVFSLSWPFHANDRIFAPDDVTLEAVMASKTIPNDQDKVFFKTWIDRKQLVAAFYNAVLSFEKSDKYAPQEWEYQPFDKILCKKLNMNHEQLVNHLLSFTEDKLKKIFSENDKSGSYNEPDSFYLHENYNSLSIKEKTDKIEQYLKWNANHWDGTSLSDFRSEIIENYLKGG